MEILLSCYCVSDIVWLHHLDFIEMLEEVKLLKNATYCFLQILEVESNKTVAVRPLTSHCTNHQRKMNKTCWAMLLK